MNRKQKAVAAATARKVGFARIKNHLSRELPNARWDLQRWLGAVAGDSISRSCGGAFCPFSDAV
jgi:hypothetical protein